MKEYTVEEFKKRKIAVLVKNEIEYEIFKKFAKGFCWFGDKKHPNLHHLSFL